MTKVLTVRIEPELLGKAEARAVELGMDRAGYVRGLIEEDLARAGKKRGARFASEDLVGKYRLGGKPATNARAREQLRKRAGGK